MFGLHARSIRTITLIATYLTKRGVLSGPPTGPPLAAKVQIVVHPRVYLPSTRYGMSCRVHRSIGEVYEDDGGRRRSVVLTVHLGGFLN